MSKRHPVKRNHPWSFAKNAQKKIKKTMRKQKKVLKKIGVFVCLLCAITNVAIAEDKTTIRMDTAVLIEAPYTWDDEQIATATICGEAVGESYLGKLAVAEVIRNRMKQTGSSSAFDICLAPKQFSYWNSKRWAIAFVDRLNANDYHQCGKAWWESEESNVVEGATHYHTIYVYPSWARKLRKIKEIGNHVFYKEIRK